MTNPLQLERRRVNWLCVLSFATALGSIAFVYHQHAMLVDYVANRPLINQESICPKQ